MIEIKTTKSTILIVDLPDGVTQFAVLPDIADGIKINVLYLRQIDQYIELHLGDWQLLGKTFELTEEQCAAIVPQMKDSGYPFEVQLYRETFDDMLAANQVYKENPLGNQPEFVFNQYGKSPIEFARFEKDMFDWQQAQSRTMPNSVILIKKS